LHDLDVRSPGDQQRRQVWRRSWNRNPSGNPAACHADRPFELPWSKLPAVLVGQQPWRWPPLDVRRERPWRARLAAAWEPDRVKAFLTTQDYGGPDGAYAAAHGLSNDPAVKTAITAALSWLATAGAEDDGTGAELTDEEFADLFGRAGRPPRGIQQGGE